MRTIPVMASSPIAGPRAVTIAATPCDRRTGRTSALIAMAAMARLPATAPNQPTPARPATVRCTADLQPDSSTPSPATPVTASRGVSKRLVAWGTGELPLRGLRDSPFQTSCREVMAWRASWSQRSLLSTPAWPATLTSFTCGNPAICSRRLATRSWLALAFQPLPSRPSA